MFSKFTSVAVVLAAALSVQALPEVGKFSLCLWLLCSRMAHHESVITQLAAKTLEAAAVASSPPFLTHSPASVSILLVLLTYMSTDVFLASSLSDAIPTASSSGSVSVSVPLPSVSGSSIAVPIGSGSSSVTLPIPSGSSISVPNPSSTNSAGNPQNSSSGGNTSGAVGFAAPSTAFVGAGVALLAALAGGFVL
jgi:hypothetical protein